MQPALYAAMRTAFPDPMQKEKRKKALVASDAKTGKMLGFRDVTDVTEEQIKATEEQMLKEFVDRWPKEEIKEWVRSFVRFTVTEGETIAPGMFPQRPTGPQQ
jgi:hypothetical protein